MPRLRYLGRDEEGDPIWVEPREATHLTPRHDGKPQSEMTQSEAVLHGYKNLENKGWRSAFSKQEILRTWKE